MALEPAMQYDRHTGQIITWYYRDGVTKKPLTGATITATLTTPEGVKTAVSGVLTVTDGPNAVFSWAYGASDTLTISRYIVRFTAVYLDGKQDSSFDMDWQVL